MSEKLCFQWNKFQENIKGVFRDLREDNDFADVTLACEDGRQVEAHKVILAASSPFFQKLLGRIKHAHPLIYMRGMTSVDLLAIVDFLYCGEANVFQENLDSFLAIAEELQLKGLMWKLHEKEEDFNTDDGPLQETPKPPTNTSAMIPETSFNAQNLSSKIFEANEDIPSNVSGALKELEESVRAMMEKSQNNYGNGQQKAYLCKVCGKEGKGNAIKDHIEANHLEGISIPCHFCDKTFRSRNALRQHKNIRHK